MFDTVSAAADDAGRTTIETEIVHPRPGVALLTVRGEVDTVTAAPLDAALRILVDGDDAVLAVDLAGIAFFASSGLAVLIRAAHRAAATGRRLRLIVEGRPVRHPLEITGTDRLFDMHTDRDAALRNVDTVQDIARRPRD